MCASEYKKTWILTLSNTALPVTFQLRLWGKDQSSINYLGDGTSRTSKSKTSLRHNLERMAPHRITVQEL